MKWIFQEEKEEDHLPILNKDSEIGIDEVGRGSVFGPVFSAAIVLTKKNELTLKKLGVNDSKKLTPKKRKDIFPKIIALSSDYAVGQSSVREIDNFGIRYATELSMIRAVKKLRHNPSELLIDGPFSLRLEKCCLVPYPLFLNMKYPGYLLSNLSIKESRVTLAIMLAAAIEVNLESPEIIFL
jgi:ribonuclease HII